MKGLSNNANDIKCPEKEACGCSEASEVPVVKILIDPYVMKTRKVLKSRANDQDLC